MMSEPIYRYTRRQALADGLLVDVSEMAREAGIIFPVAVTGSVWQQYVVVPEGVECQDEQGRLWDILWMLRCAVAQSRGGHEILYTLYVRNDNQAPLPVRLKAVCGPDDDGQPVITLMLPEED